MTVVLLTEEAMEKPPAMVEDVVKFVVPPSVTLKPPPKIRFTL